MQRQLQQTEKIREHLTLPDEMPQIKIHYSVRV